MNKKKKMPKFLSALLSFSMAFGTVIPAYATEMYMDEILPEETELETAQLDDENSTIEVEVNESRYEDVEVNYSQSSSYFVTIPKTINLGADKKSPYSIKVEGDIVANKQVCVVPVDGITDTEVFDFYMEDQIAGSTKENVIAEVSQAKFYWNHEEAATGYEENDNYIIADGLSAGKWKGVFQLEISMRTDPSHIHNYVGEVTKEPTCTEPGEKTYTCDCGDSYTETIDPTGHHYEHGECTNCGEKDPNHEHKYTEKVTKEPTCTEEGEKTYTCDCGDSYTEKIPAKGHHYENGTCTDCGDKDPNHEHKYTEKVTKEPTCTEEGEKTYTCDCGESYTEKIPAKGHNYVDGECEHCGEKDSYEVAPAGAYSDWNYTLDDENKIITLNYYKGTKADVIVYANYEINGVTYKAQLKNSTYTSKQASYPTNYIFANKDNVNSIKFSDSFDTSNLTNMSHMFHACHNVTSIDFGKNFDTKNITDMSYTFASCYALTNLNISSFDTGNVTDMYCMFSQCYAMTNFDLSNFDTSNVTKMTLMFYMCQSLTSLDLSNFDTGNVTDMSQMFYLCSALTDINLSSFDTSKVTNMSKMFRQCGSLTELDLSSFDTSKVTDMSQMFMTTSNLKTIYATEGRWSTAKTTTSMFSGCGTSSVTYK